MSPASVHKNLMGKEAFSGATAGSMTLNAYSSLPRASMTFLISLSISVLTEFCTPIMLLLANCSFR